MEVLGRTGQAVQGVFLDEIVATEAAMTITSKHTRCCRWTWGAITRYPHMLTREIVGMQTDYSEAEIKRALDDLARNGYVCKEEHGAGVPRGWVALVPFVVVAPAWAAI